MKTLTLHIEDREARALVMRGNRVVRWASLPIPPGVIINGVVISPGGLAKVLRQLLKCVKAGRSRPLVSLTGLHPVVRTLPLPPLKRNLFPEAVQREMQRELPRPIEHYHIFWQALESSKTETRIYALAVPTGELESYMAAFKQAQVRPKSISLEALVVASALDSNDAIVIGLKHTGFSIVVLRGGTPTLMRDIAYRQEDLPMVDRVADLGSELQLTMASVGLDGPQDANNSPLSMYIIGKNTNDDYLIKYMADEIGFVLSSFEPSASYPTDFPVLEYVPNLGLALHRRKRSAQGQPLRASLSFDLTPERYLPQTVPLWQATLLLALVVAVGSVITPFRDALDPDADILRLRAELAREQRGIDQVRNRVRLTREAQTALAKEDATAEQARNDLQQIVGPHLLWPAVLPASKQTLPDIQVLSFLETSKELTISAEAPNATAAAAFATYLEATGLFSSVTIRTLVRDTKGNSGNTSRFNLTASKKGQ